MAKVIRELVAEGECHVVECSLRSDGSSPSAEFLGALAEGMWADDPDADSLPDDAQIKHSDLLIAWCEGLAERGVPARRTAVNYLREGIWEFRLNSKRMSYYDTPGDGTYLAKEKIREHSERDYDDDFWWYPRFDEFIRLGHCFPKLGQKTEESDMRECFTVRTEDLRYDEHE